MWNVSRAARQHRYLPVFGLISAPKRTERFTPGMRLCLEHDFKATGFDDL
jgi:hypothetical protein